MFPADLLLNKNPVKGVINVHVMATYMILCYNTENSLNAKYIFYYSLLCIVTVAKLRIDNPCVGEGFND